MTPKPRPGAAAPAVAVTPQMLAAARLRSGAQRQDRPLALRDRAGRRAAQAWIARARDLGAVAINIETIGEDPMQAELCGIALAVAPNEACYVPLAHRKGGNGDGLFGGGLAPDQISEDRRARRAQAAARGPGRAQDRRRT